MSKSLTLTKRRIRIDVTEITKNLEIGQEIEYYGYKNNNIERPSIG